MMEQILDCLCPLGVVVVDVLVTYLEDWHAGGKPNVLLDCLLENTNDFEFLGVLQHVNAILGEESAITTKVNGHLSKPDLHFFLWL